MLGFYGVIQERVMSVPYGGELFKASKGSSFLVENDVLMKSVMLTQNISIYLKYSKMPPSTGGCSRYFFIPNGHEIPNPIFDEHSGPLRGPDGSTDAGTTIFPIYLPYFAA